MNNTNKRSKVIFILTVTICFFLFTFVLSLRNIKTSITNIILSCIYLFFIIYFCYVLYKILKPITRKSVNNAFYQTPNFNTINSNFRQLYPKELFDFFYLTKKYELDGDYFFHFHSKNKSNKYKVNNDEYIYASSPDNIYYYFKYENNKVIYYENEKGKIGDINNLISFCISKIKQTNYYETKNSLEIEISQKEFNKIYDLKSKTEIYSFLKPYINNTKKKEDLDLVCETILKYNTFLISISTSKS